jgi:hypothetical protein
VSNIQHVVGKGRRYNLGITSVVNYDRSNTAQLGDLFGTRVLDPWIFVTDAYAVLALVVFRAGFRPYLLLVQRSVQAFEIIREIVRGI